MLFNSFSYVLFLWTAYVVWWSLQRRRSLRHSTMLLGSYWFYGQAHWGYVSLLIVSTVVDYVAGARIHQARLVADESRAKSWMGASIVINLGMLAVFKYFDFFSTSVQDLLGCLGIEVQLWQLHLVLPIGISFYTFQSLSYSLDIYRGRLEPVEGFIDFAMYVAFFPQLIAGPIVRARQFLPQLLQPAKMTSERLSSGVYQVMLGLTKKLLLADILGSHLVDPFLTDPTSLGTLDALDIVIVGMGFILQLYGDFGGYSDIAIGSARMLGLELPPNFATPLRSASVDEYWRRWHISMTSWFRDYLFVPLAGERPSLARRCVATVLTFLIVGLWHGAAWTFVLFGLAHGLALSGILLFRQMARGARFRSSRWWWWLSFSGTFVFVSTTVLLFRAPSIDDYLAIMRGFQNWAIDGLDLRWQVWTVFGIGMFTNLLPQSATRQVERAWIAIPAAAQGVLMVLIALALFALRPPGTTPFIYFQF